jgi:hypothetical protein
MYSILVRNSQGATDGHTANTQQEINRWLRGWSDPQNLSGTVKRDGEIVGEKRLGRKTIEWYANSGNPAAVALGALGGQATTDAKAAAARENGKRGGRPRKTA